MGNQASGQCLMADKLIAEHKDQFLATVNRTDEAKRLDVASILTKLNSDIVNFVLIAKGRKFRHSVWEMLGFSVCILYEKDVSFEFWRWACVDFHSFKFAVVTVDAMAANHVCFFLSKAKVFLEKWEFLERVVLCSENSTPDLDRFVMDEYETPNLACLAAFPSLKVVSVFENIDPSHSEVFRSSSHAAFQLYKQSRGSFSTFQGSDTFQSDALERGSREKAGQAGDKRQGKQRRPLKQKVTAPEAGAFVGAKKRRLMKKAARDAAREQEPKEQGKSSPKARTVRRAKKAGTETPQPDSPQTKTPVVSGKKQNTPKQGSLGNARPESRVTPQRSGKKQSTMEQTPTGDAKPESQAALQKSGKKKATPKENLNEDAKQESRVTPRRSAKKKTPKQTPTGDAKPESQAVLQKSGKKKATPKQSVPGKESPTKQSSNAKGTVGVNSPAKTAVKKTPKRM